MSPRRMPAHAVVALLAAGAACAHVPPGIHPAGAEETDRTAVRAPPPGWKRIAVVPFGGDPAHCRPAEELVALSLQGTVPFSVATPFAIGAALRAPGAVPRIDADGWARGYAEQREVSTEDVRKAAAWLAADALVLGRVEPGGSFTDLVLVDAASGEHVAALRRAGSAWAAEHGVHELAMDSTARALEGLLAVLRTKAGEAPRMPRARTSTAGGSVEGVP